MPNCERLQPLVQGDLDAVHIAWRLMSCLALLPTQAIVTLLDSRVSLLAPEVFERLGDARVAQLCTALRNDDALISRAYKATDEAQRISWLPWVCKLSVWLSSRHGELPQCVLLTVPLLVLEQPETTGQRLLDRVEGILPLDWITEHLIRRCNNITAVSVADLVKYIVAPFSLCLTPAGDSNWSINC